MKLKDIKNLIKLKSRNVRRLIANWIYSGPTSNDILDAQMEYIQMLQNNSTTLYMQLTEMLRPVIECNKLMQAELKVQREYNYQIKHLDNVVEVNKKTDV